ncbi:MAG: MinD/ParA family protein [Lentisphaerae bacterium]|nr:MinD/ParA family protein [Lentisphaerota bacterium]
MDFHAVCTTTGIAPNRIRYFESEFRDFLGLPPQVTAIDDFDEHQVQLFLQIHRMMVEEGLPVSDVRQHLQRLRESRRQALRIITVTSGKGGVGKTTLSLNLAIAIATTGQRTLLIDADMGLGNVHVLAGLQPHGTILDVVDNRAAIDDILIDGPAGLRVMCGASGIPELADLDPHRLERLVAQVNQAAHHFDVIVVDTAAGIAAQVTRFLRLADDIVLVTTPNIAATLDAYGMLKVVHHTRMRGRVHVVVNLVESNKQATAVFERLRDCAQRFLNVETAHLGQLQKHGSVERANQNRRPLMLEAPDSLNANRIRTMAAALCAAPPLAAPDTDEAARPMDLLVRSFAGATR